VPLNPAVSTSDLIENYFKAEVLPHVNDAWINADKRDAKMVSGDCRLQIPFNRHFYVYQPPRPLKRLMPTWMRSVPIMKLLQEVHS
jgi:type I restriction enzyme M protein